MVESGGPGFKDSTLPLATRSPEFKSSVCQLGVLTTLSLFEIFVSLFQWHACKLTKLDANIAKCMTTLSKIYIYSFITLVFTLSGKK